MFAAAAVGRDDAVLLTIALPVELVDSVGEDGVPTMEGGADVFPRRSEMVPIVVEGLINGTGSRLVAESVRTGAPRPPVGLTGDCGSTSLPGCRGVGVESTDFGEGRGGRGCDSRLTSRTMLLDRGLLSSGAKVSDCSDPSLSDSSGKAPSLLPDPTLLWLTEGPRNRPDASCGGLSACKDSNSGGSTTGGVGGGDVVGSGAGGGRLDDARGRPT